MCSARTGTKVCVRLIIRAKNTLSELPWKKWQGKEMQENSLALLGTVAQWRAGLGARVRWRSHQ